MFARRASTVPRGSVLAAAVLVRFDRLSRISRQVASSGIATAVDLLLLIVLCKAAGVPPVVAATVAAIGGGAMNFVIGRVWVFEARGPVLAQAVGYAGLVVAGGAVVSGIVVGGIETMGVPLLVAKAMAIGVVMVGWTYPVSAKIFQTR